MQKNKAFCSICTSNYLSYAKLLEKSLRKAGHSEKYYLLVLDYDESIKKYFENTEIEIVTLDDLKIPEIDNLIKKYSPFELSNNLKPFFIEWLLTNNDLQYLIYLDTDIYVYQKLDEIFEYFEKNPDLSVVLTPHLNSFESYSKYSDYEAERLFMASGLYNGGFYAIKNDANAIKFLDWQKERLSNYGYNANSVYMFVDQKILDIAPELFEFVGIYKNSAYNVGHWNYYSGALSVKNGEYYFEDKKLVFFHFSQLKISDTNQNENKLYTIDLTKEKVLFEMCKNYWSLLLKEDYNETKNLPYKFKDVYKSPELAMVNPLLAKQKEFDAAQTEVYRLQKEYAVLQNDYVENVLKVNDEKEQLNQQNYALQLQIIQIYQSKSWKLIAKLRKLFSKFFPENSFQRKAVFKIIRISFGSLRKVKSFSRNLKNNLKKLSPGYRKRNANKLIYIGHSYHSKTKSTRFLVDYFKNFFEVEEVFDESWNAKPYPDISFIDETYFGIVFFQSVPPIEILKSLKNKNLTFIPMYDAYVNAGDDFWMTYKDLNFKIINFSKTLHDHLLKLGLNSIYVQYFPEPSEFFPGNPNEIFFWQRLTRININNIVKLFENFKPKIHIHKAIDPGQEFIEPTKDVESELSITYSDWFEKKEDMIDLMKSKGIYVAPREYEGIGQSFLEAMSMGKAVIAVNNPTMNEYIQHGVTGYLFTLGEEEPVDFSNITVVQKNTHKYMLEGYKKWQSDKENIINFIKTHK